MLKKVIIRIESIIDILDASGLPEGDSEKSITETDGIYKITPNEARLSYKEQSEGGVSESEIVIIGDGVAVRRRGAIESELYFKEGESHSSIYSIPPFRFDAEVYSKKVRIELNEDGGRINLLYNMKIGGAEKATIMRIWISKA